MDVLQTVRDLQFSEKGKAEALLFDFVRGLTPFDILSVELTPRPTSLNSINGFFHLRDGNRLFFKTHTESHTLIDEYYNAELLAGAGYPTIQPIFSSTEVGKQLLVYEVIESPSVFDLAWQFEQGDLTQDSYLWSNLVLAQTDADQQLAEIYERTLQTQSGIAVSPIHQLFYHRLMGGRLKAFYAQTQLQLPHGTFSFEQVAQVRWVINQQVYDLSLAQIIERAIHLLNPAQLSTPTIIGHGDAHNGNVFLQGERLLYFDPAFAGYHHPLLDLAKPMFHNVFAMWMYFPQVKAQSSQIACHILNDNLWQVEYHYELPTIRRLFLDQKKGALIACLKQLKAVGMLDRDWRALLKSALFCCPFLTMNLADSQRFPASISLLGLAMSVEMGAESRETRSLIDQVLDEAEQAL